VGASPLARQVHLPRGDFLCTYLCVTEFPSIDYTREIDVFEPASSPSEAVDSEVRSQTSDVRCRKITRFVGPKRSRAQLVLLALNVAGKDLQPEPFEQSHAHDVLMFVADGNVVEENSFQLETKPAVEIDIAHVDVARVDVNLVQVPDHESIIKKAECRPFPDAFALRPGLAHQLFHLEFPRRRIDVLAADDSHRLVVVIDAEIVPSRIGEILLQLAYILRKCRHEAFADRRNLQPCDDLADDLQLQRTKRHVLDDKLFAFRPFVLHRCQRKYSVVILHAFG